MTCWMYKSSMDAEGTEMDAFYGPGSFRLLRCNAAAAEKTVTNDTSRATSPKDEDADENRQVE